jgi:hypothetical protein
MKNGSMGYGRVCQAVVYPMKAFELVNVAGPFGKELRNVVHALFELFERLKTQKLECFVADGDQFFVRVVQNHAPTF